MHPKPHVSSALKQLRGWVTILALVVAGCGLTQALVFATANYTSTRSTELRSGKGERGPLKIVSADESPAPNETVTTLRERASGTTPLAAHTPINPNVTKTETDSIMARASLVACSLGTLACIVLCVMCLLGVVVAGGGQVTGVESVVTGGVWSLVLALLCLPWSDMAPSLGVPGVFASYAQMTGVIDGDPAAIARMSWLGLHGQWAAMPLLAAFLSVGICMWFRAGVERGIIVTTPSQLDRAIEREAADLAKRGVSNGTVRSVGALERAIGEQPAAAAPTPSLESAIENAASTAQSIAGDLSPSMISAAGKGRSVVDRGFKRLI